MPERGLLAADETSCVAWRKAARDRNTPEAVAIQEIAAPHDLRRVRSAVPRAWRRVRADPVLAQPRERPDDGALFGTQAATSRCRQRFNRDRAGADPTLTRAGLSVMTW